MSGTPHSPYLELIARSLGPPEGLYVLLAADPLIIVKNVWNKCRISGLPDEAIYPGFNVLYLAGLATLLGGKLFSIIFIYLGVDPAHHFTEVYQHMMSLETPDTDGGPCWFLRWRMKNTSDGIEMYSYITIISNLRFS